MSSTIKKGRIKSLEGLRAFAFLGVVFCHTGLGKGTFSSVGLMGVSLFFILSGFVLVYSQIDKTNYKPSIKYNFKYLAYRLKKLYPLFVLATLSMVIFNLVGETKESVGATILQLALNLALLQEWPPIRLRSFCGPAWFLCPLALFYFVFPNVLKKIQKDYTEDKAKTSIVILIVIEIVIALISYFLPRPTYSKDMFLEYNIVNWFVYRFPLSRLIDCLIGCNLGYLYVSNKDKKISYATLKEAVAIILCLVASVIASVVSPITPLDAKIPSVDYTIGWSYSLIFLPGSILAIYLFAYNQGKVSKFFENKFFMYLANISVYGFLIHSVIFTYFSKVVYFVLGNSDAAKLFMKQYGSWINLTLGFFLTLVACQIWIWLIGLFSKKKQMEK